MDNYSLADNFRRWKLWAAKNLNAAPLHRCVKQPFEIGKSCADATFAVSISVYNPKPMSKSFLSRSGTRLTDGKCTKRNLDCLNANKPEIGGFKQFQKYKANRSNVTTSSHLKDGTDPISDGLLQKFRRRNFCFGYFGSKCDDVVAFEN
ncbi:hypothetical protein [Neisseria sicca]|uniref:hypothetical protein n=1 Tax=Neisseria sicca TaxID=490 RepID=UPI001957CD11|nr:hypothetical protein [Neisseria sicca]